MQSWDNLKLQLFKTIIAEVFASRFVALVSLLTYLQSAKVFYQLQKKEE